MAKSGMNIFGETRDDVIVRLQRERVELMTALKTIRAIASTSGDTFRDLTHPRERIDTIRDCAHEAIAKAESSS